MADDKIVYKKISQLEETPEIYGPESVPLNQNGRTFRVTFDSVLNWLFRLIGLVSTIETIAQLQTMPVRFKKGVFVLENGKGGFFKYASSGAPDDVNVFKASDGGVWVRFSGNLFSREEINNKIDAAVTQSQGAPIAVTGSVLPQGNDVPASITVSGVADLYGGTGGTTYTQAGGAAITVSQGKFKKGYYNRSTNLWVGSLQEFDLPTVNTDSLVKKDSLGSGKNKFDKNNIVNGYVSNNNIVLQPEGSYATTANIIPVEFGKTYFGKGNAYGIRTALWFINGVHTATGYIDVNTPGQNAISPPNASVNGVRVSVWKIDVNSFQLEEGDSQTEYSSYGVVSIDGKPISAANSYDKSETYNKTESNSLLAVIDGKATLAINESALKVAKSDVVIARSKNKFDKNNIVSGYLNGNGTIAASGTYDTTSGIIPVEFGKSYFGKGLAHGMRRVLWYIGDVRSTEGFLDVNTPGVNAITPPIPSVDGVRVSVWHHELDSFQLEEGVSQTSYVAFGSSAKSILGAKIEGISEEKANELFYNKQAVDDKFASIDIAFVSNSIFPKRMYALVGQQFNLYYDSFNIMPEYGGGVPSFLYSVDCTIGQQRYRSFNFIPTLSQVGTYQLVFNYLDANGSIKESLTTTLEVVERSPFAVAKNVLFIADSTWHNRPEPTKTIYDICQDMGGNTPVFFGKQRTPWSSEARSGYSFSNFVNGRSSFKMTFTGVPPGTDLSDLSQSSYYFGTAANYVRFVDRWVINPDGTGYAIGYNVLAFTPPTSFPTTATRSGSNATFPATINVTGMQQLTGFSIFKDNEGIGALNIDYYVESVLGKPVGTKLDVVCFDLGINDTTSPTANVSLIINNIRIFIAALILHNANIKIILCLPKMRGSDNSYSERKNSRWTIQRLRKAMLESFDFHADFPNVFISQAALGVDRFYAYPMQTGSQENPSSRLTSLLSDLKVISDPVHPNGEGAAQEGDAVSGLFVKLVKSI